MSKKIEDFPDEIPEGVRLFLRKGKWAIELQNRAGQWEIYTFPEYVTKDEAMDVIRRANDLRRKN